MSSTTDQPPRRSTFREIRNPNAMRYPMTIEPIGGANDLRIAGLTVQEQIAELCKEIDRSIERGGIKHLVDVLTKLGYAITPPQTPDVH